METIFTKNEVIIKKMEAKLQTQNVAELKDIVKKMTYDFKPEADIILSVAMSVLEKRIPSPEFVAFLDSI